MKFIPVLFALTISVSISITACANSLTTNLSIHEVDERKASSEDFCDEECGHPDAPQGTGTRATDEDNCKSRGRDRRNCFSV